MISRVLGMVREIMIAATLGATDAADAFYAAFRLPNLFRRIFGEGAFNLAFVPLFTKSLEDGDKAARRLGEEALAMLASVLFIFTLLATLAMPIIVYLIAAGFASEPEKLDLTVLLARIMFPYLALVSLTAMFSAVLNALGKFAVAAGAPILLNIFLISFAAFAMAAGKDVAIWLAIAVTVSGVAQLWLVVWAARKAGMRFSLRRPRLTPDMKRLLLLAAPAALAGGAMQINLMVGSVIASFFDGAVAWLTFADRIYQLPLGVVGVAVGVVLMPELSRRAKQGDREGASFSMNRSTEFALALTLPATVALLVIAEEIARGLFERGAYTSFDASQTGLAASLFALGLPAFVLNKVLTPGFFADEDSKTPLRLSLWAMGINTVLSLIGVWIMGWLAIPIATSIASWINVWMLWQVLRRRGYGGDLRLWQRVKRMMAASLVMGLVLLGATWLLDGSLELPLARVLGLFGLVLLGLGTYVIVARAFGAFTLAELKGGLRRG
jgi:putative peptidoglycan lipid II flippase